jgi:hypothetical protein
VVWMEGMGVMEDGFKFVEAGWWPYCVYFYATVSVILPPPL